MTDKKSPETSKKTESSNEIEANLSKKNKPTKNNHIAKKSKAEINQEKRPLNEEKTEKTKQAEQKSDSKAEVPVSSEVGILETTKVVPEVVTTEMLQETVVDGAIDEPPLEEVEESTPALEEDLTDTEELTEEAEPDYQEEPKHHSKAWIWWLLGIVLLILCGIGGFILAQNLSHHQENNEVTMQPEPEEDENTSDNTDPEENPSGEEPKEEEPVTDPGPETHPAGEVMPPIVDRPQNNDYPEVTPGSRLIALTFDDGPSPATTPRLLDILKGRNVKATFFVLGNLASRNPDLLRREAAEGHEVASHTPYHDQLTRLSAAQVRAQALEMDRIFTDILGTVPPFTRPPYGSYNDTVRTALAQPLIIWSIDPRDWADRNANIVCSRVTNAAFDGAIILVHDIHATTVDAVPCIIDNLRARGYEFLTVSELAAARDVPLVNGGVYGSF